MQKHIYMDYSASTPVDERVIEAMMPYWTEVYGNSESSHHFGRQAQLGLSQSRRTVADLINAEPGEIIFAGCGSECDNLALRGVMMAARASGRGNHLITCAIEHKAVLGTAMQLQDHFGCEVTVLGVDQYGQVDVEEVRAAIRPETALISIMAANNEIGSMQPFLEIGALAHEQGISFHTDAVQAAGYLAWDMAEMPIDLMSMAPHKFYGPKGVGILYLRKGTDYLSPLTGGGQEEGRRAGTVNVPFAVGGAVAFELMMENRLASVAHYTSLRDRLIEGVLAAIPAGCQLTGHRTKRLPHHTSFAFEGLSGNDLLIQLDAAGVAGSSGSACNTGNPKPSATLQALGLDDTWTKGGLRLTLGKQNTTTDVDHVLTALPKAVQQLRSFSQLLL